jgi:hypothetical protein
VDRAGVVLCTCLCATAQAAIPDGAFVRAAGGALTVEGKPFRFVGANLEVMHGEPARARHAETIEAAHRDGLTVGRVWALGEGPADASPHDRAHVLFRAGPDGFIESAYQQLDRVLAAARQRDLRVIITLANHWSDYGGIPQYVAWGAQPGASFYADPRLRDWFRAHLARLVGRTSSVTGVRYADDPTIFSWELVNESQAIDPARRPWVVEMAREIRRADANHLIGSAVQTYGVRRDRAEWLSLCRLPEIDYCDAHLYPQGPDATDTLDDLYDLIDDRAQLARHVARKPLIFGELGFDTRREQDGWLARPRAQWFALALARARRDGAAGVLTWIYQPWSGRPRDYGIYVDRPDTDDVRTVLREAARSWRDDPAPPPNPRLSPRQADRPLFAIYKTRHAGAAVHAIGDPITLPSEFTTGRFERLGTYASGAITHAYGDGDGFFEWRFTAGAPLRTPRLETRLSSEFPGSAGPPDGGSTIHVLLDGRRIATLDVISDDGKGRAHVLPLPSLGAGAHTLRLVVPAGPRAHGLCVYGASTITSAPARTSGAAPPADSP